MLYHCRDMDLMVSLVCRGGIRSSASSRTTGWRYGYCTSVGGYSWSTNSVYQNFQANCDRADCLLEHTVAKSANPIEIGRRLHVRLPSEENGVAVAVVEVLLDMMMTGGPTGIGIGIARGVMRMTMAPHEVVAVDPTMIDLTVTGRAVTATHLKLAMHCLPNSSIMSLLQPHL